MAKFSDTAGREWSIGMTIGGANDVKKALAIDLLEPLGGTPPVLTRLELDLALLINVVFVLVRDQRSEVTDQEFGKQLGGGAVAELRKAFWAEYADFFQSLGRPEVVQAIRQQQLTVDRAIELANRKVELAGTKVRNQLEKTASESPESGFTGSPAMPA